MTGGSPLRILLVNAFAAKLGGAEVHVHTLIEELTARGHAVGFFAGDPELDEDSEQRCIVRRPEFDGATLVRDETLETRFAAFAARFRPDIVHLHNTHYFSLGFLGRAASAGAAVLQTVHDAGYLCPNSWMVHGDGAPCPGGPGAQCFRHGCEANYPYDGRVVLHAKLRLELMRTCVQAFPCPSQFLAERMAAHGMPRAHWLPLWADPPSAPASAPAREPDRVLFLGRLVREKGVEYLVRAWPRVVQQRPSARLSIVGDGPELEPLRALAAGLGLDPAAIFTGRIPHGEVGEHLARATCQVVPSIWCENAPVSIHEGLARGLPIVASDLGGLPALVVEGRTGLLARARDPEHLAERLLELLADRDLQARLGRGCLEAAARFTREAHFDALLRLYRELAREGPPNPRSLDGLWAELAPAYEHLVELERRSLATMKAIRTLQGPA